MVKETKAQDGSFNFNQDFYDEFIYRMDKNEIRNLDQLNDYKVLTGKSSSIRRATTKKTIEETSKGVLLLDRKVIVKQYAPKTFKKIRDLSNVTD